eukprot:jgi/Tetstr1/445023/TSEL_032831.t1
MSSPPSSAEAARLVAAQLARNPAAARQRDRDGRLPLHHALLDDNPDPAVVLALLEAFPNGAAQQDQSHELISLREEVGEHVIRTPSAGREIVELLLAAAPLALGELMTRDKETPLHLAADRVEDSPMVVAVLVQACPAWCEAFDEAGELPLHKAAGNLSAGVVALLLEAYPDGARSQGSLLASGTKRTPLHTACANLNLAHNKGKDLSAVALPLLDAFPSAAEQKDAYGR